MIAPPRILMAVDSVEAGEMLASMLAGEPWQVLAADGGELALRLVEKAEPQVAILNMHLKGIDGLELCRRLRGERQHRLLPVVMVGCESLAERVAALEAGADDLLTRPFDRSEVTARLRSLLHLKSLYDHLEETRRVVFALAKAAEAKDPFTLHHAERVADLACGIAARLGMGADALDQIRTGALVHDVGKIAVPDAILQKPAGLTPEEYEMVKRHVVVGAEIVAPLSGQKDFAAIVRNHHERFDGAGYPDGLAGDAIPLVARIVAVCDAFDAMTNVRPYRPAMPRQHAIDCLRAGRGTQWDPDLVDVFVAAIDSESTASAMPIDR